MQGFALSVSDKQLIKTFFITFIAVVAGLPVASALMPTRENALAHDSGAKNAVSKTAEELGLGACGTATGTGSAKKTSSSHTHEVVTRTVTQNGNNNQNGTNNSQNNGGATAQVGRDGIAAAVNANVLNDLVDVNDVLNNNTVSVPVNVPILSGTNSGNGSGGLLGLGILGL